MFHILLNETKRYKYINSSITYQIAYPRTLVIFSPPSIRKNFALHVSIGDKNQVYNDYTNIYFPKAQTSFTIKPINDIVTASSSTEWYFSVVRIPDECKNRTLVSTHPKYRLFQNSLMNKSHCFLYVPYLPVNFSLTYESKRNSSGISIYYSQDVVKRYEGSTNISTKLDKYDSLLMTFNQGRIGLEASSNEMTEDPQGWYGNFDLGLADQFIETVKSFPCHYRRYRQPYHDIKGRRKFIVKSSQNSKIPSPFVNSVGLWIWIIVGCTLGIAIAIMFTFYLCQKYKIRKQDSLLHSEEQDADPVLTGSDCLMSSTPGFVAHPPPMEMSNIPSSV